MLKPSILFSALLLSITACKQKSPVLFERLSESSTGVDFRNLLDEGPEMNVLNYSYFYNGGGVAVGDINNDGLSDLVFTGNMVKNRIFLNKGNMKFEDITQKSGIADKQGWCTGVTMVDINEDGFLDIYISRSADVDPDRRKNLLFINNGDLTFAEKAAEYGLDDSGYSTQASFFDYDKDGDLDMFLINHSLQQYTTGAQENPELRTMQNPDFANKLYRNEGGKFQNASDEAGIKSNVLTFGLGVAVSDVNNDGWPDVYVSNDFNEPDYLYINNQNGTFSDRLAESMSQVSMYSMGSDFADYNNDGLADLVTLDMLAEDNATQKMHSGAENFDKMQMLFNKGFFFQFSRNMLQKNNGDGTFSEIGQLAGISNTDWSWASLLSDFDNDGKKDLFITNGYVKDYTDMDFLKFSVDRTIRSRQGGDNMTVSDIIEKMPTINMPNYIFRNIGGDQFEKANGDWGMTEKGVSAGAVYADLDNDGDLDMVVSNINEYASIYQNNSNKLNKNNYLRVNLQGSKSNLLGVGAKVTLYAKGELFYQEQIPVRGFQSSVDPVLVFGLGEHQALDSVKVIWPDDKIQVFNKVKPGQTLTVKHSDALDGSFVSVNPSTLLTMTPLAGARHLENEFNDFTVQGLLPYYLSRQGPALATGDVNGDGLDDVYIGGAAGQGGAVYLQKADGSFRQMNQDVFLLNKDSEDTVAEFFDSDGDGDLDLYVGSGGYEFEIDDPLLQDRLYLNDGRGNFRKSENSLPVMLSSTGAVSSADFDGDGDLDLFVGGRVVPGKYPENPESRILLNQGRNQFTDATGTVAPDLKNIGMVSGAVWIDVNSDKKEDLVLVGEWMPIKVYINKDGKLHDQSEQFVKFSSKGLWNTLYAEDLDGDGDKDLIVGNLGTNGQFKASEKEPVSIHFKDFDGNGSVDPIFCYYIHGVSYPTFSRDDLTEQLPMLRARFTDYKSYSTATLKDVFTEEQLKDAEVLEAATLQTVYLQNNGKAGFKLMSLPVEAQYAPVYAINSADMDGDGLRDLLLAGNNSWARIKFGHYTASNGIMLKGDGKGGFTYTPQWKSGLKLKGDVRGLGSLKNKTNKPMFVAGVNNAQTQIIKIK